ncbi:MAG TPA: SDR family oxidoreductase [Actinomycetes bacterium]
MPTALITGGTAGIGAEFARRLAARGHDLVLVARDLERLDATAADLKHRFGGTVEVLPTDLAEREQCARVEARLADRDRPVDLLVNNAGFGTGHGFSRGQLGDEERQLDVLVRAVLRLSHAAVGGMVERRHGGIVNVSSVAAWTATGTYSAAKAWVTTFSEGLDAELAGTGVRVVAVAAGFTRTEFHARAGMDMRRVPDWMWLDADQVVRAALAALGTRRTVVVPGRQYRLLAGLARHAPSRLVARAARPNG